MNKTPSGFWFSNMAFIFSDLLIQNQSIKKAIHTVICKTALKCCFFPKVKGNFIKKISLIKKRKNVLQKRTLLNLLFLLFLFFLKQSVKRMLKCYIINYWHNQQA